MNLLPNRESLIKAPVMFFSTLKFYFIFFFLSSSTCSSLFFSTWPTLYHVYVYIQKCASSQLILKESLDVITICVIYQRCWKGWRFRSSCLRNQVVYNVYIWKCSCICNPISFCFFQEITQRGQEEERMEFHRLGQIKQLASNKSYSRTHLSYIYNIIFTIIFKHRNQYLSYYFKYIRIHLYAAKKS